jgi:hypothetical protein
MLSAVSILSRGCLEGGHQRIAIKLGMMESGLILSVCAISKKYSKGGEKRETYVGIK